MRILVTGGMGFLGSRIVKVLNSEYSYIYDDLHILDNRIPTNSFDEGGVSVISYLEGDICDIIPKLKPYDIVFHCAGLLGTETRFKDIVETERVNVMGTLAVLELQKTSGIIVHPGLTGKWLNPYMISKNTAERYGLMYRKWYNTRYVSVRPTDIYGEGQSVHQHKITPTFILNALQGEPLPVYGDGEYKVRMIYVDDIAHVMVGIGMKEVLMDETVDATSLLPTNFIAVKDYAELIIDMTGSPSEVEYMPMRMGQPASVKTATVDVCQTGRLYDLLGFTETSLTDGLERTIDYYSS